MLFNKSLKSLLLIFSFLSFIPVFAQNNFEGKIVFKISGEQTADVDYFVKGDKIRMEVDAEENTVVILYHPKESKTYMIIPGQKMYMEMGNEFIPEKKYDTEGKTENLKKTGEYKEINGYKCEKWLFNEEDKEIEAWMTDKLGNFYMLMNPMDKSTESRWQEKLQGDYFPMKVVVMENGNLKSSMEVLSVEKSSLNEDLFNIPGGYHKLDMPNMNMLKQN